MINITASGSWNFNTILYASKEQLKDFPALLKITEEGGSVGPAFDGQVLEL